MATPRYAVGDRVIVKSLGELSKEFVEQPGGAFETPFCYFTKAMREFCGGEYDVEDVEESPIGTFFYRLTGTDWWNFDEATLLDLSEPALDVDSMAVRYDDLF